MKKYGIICAVDAEIAPFLEKAEIRSTKKIAGLEFHEAMIANVDAVLVRCGMGKVNAAIATMIMIQEYAPELIINAGVNGALDPKMKLFDVLVCKKCTHHDLPMPAIIADYPKMDDVWFYADQNFIEKAVAVSSCAESTMVTGEIFVDDDSRAKIKEQFAGETMLATDMETAAIAQCATAAGTPFAAVRAISDMADGVGMDIFWQNVTKAAKIAAEETIKVLQTL